MASFLNSQPTKFNPYIPTIPVQERLAVGMAKQQQYDAGVQRVQQYIDSVNGMDVATKFKGYVGSKLSNLEGRIKQVASADFSDQQLVSQIGAATGEIAKDPVVQNALISTQLLRHGQQQMQKDLDNGTASPSNVYYFEHQVNSWLNDGNLNSSFKGSYLKYSDYNKHAIDALKSLNPTVTEVPWLRNADGTPKLDSRGNPQIDSVMLKQTGLSEQQVRDAISTALTEQDKQQIAIDGIYAYRGLDQDAMAQLIKNSTTSQLSQINARIDKINNVEKKVNPNDKTYQSKLDNELQYLNQKKDDAAKLAYRGYDEIKNNLEEFKAKLYTTKYVDQFAKAYSYTSNEFVDNPYQKVKQWEADYNLSVQKFNHDLDKDAFDKAYKTALLKIKQDKALQSKNGFAPGGGIAGEVPTNLTPKQLLDNFTEQLNGDAETIRNNARAIAQQYGIKEEDLNELLAKREKGADLGPALNSDLDAFMELQKGYINKLAGFTKVGQAADEKFDPQIHEKVKNFEPFILPDGTKISPEEIKKFGDALTNEKNWRNKGNGLQLFLPTLNSITHPTDVNTYSTVNLTKPKEFIPQNAIQAKLYQQYKSSISFNPNAHLSKSLILPPKLSDYLSGLNSTIGDETKQKSQFIAEQLTKRLNLNRDAYYTLQDGKTEQLKAIKQKVNAFLTRADVSGKDIGDDGRHFDYDEVSKMVTGKDNGKTEFGFARTGDGKAYFTLTNSAVSKDVNFIPATEDDLQKVAPELARQTLVGEDIVNTISLNGGKSTNVAGPQYGYFQSRYFPGLRGAYGNRFTATADVNKSALSNTYELVLHVYDNQNPQLGWKDIPYYEPVDESKLSNISNVLSQITPLSIAQYFPEPKK